MSEPARSVAQQTSPTWRSRSQHSRTFAVRRELAGRMQVQTSSWVIDWIARCSGVGNQSLDKHTRPPLTVGGEFTGAFVWDRVRCRRTVHELGLVAGPAHRSREWWN